VTRAPDAYSRAIGWLKLLLPVLGLGILSTLFLFARETRIERRELDASAVAPGGGVETVGRPDYSGVTADGAGISITAASAWPAANGSGDFEGVDIAAHFDLPDGEQADIRAENGTLSPARDVLSLEGQVEVDTVSGWSMRSDRLEASLDWTRIVSPGEVRSEGPLGSLDAGSMVITRDKAGDGPYLMDFSGGVRLVYAP
jgi:lipopolysaccharide export system protein LptC